MSEAAIKSFYSRPHSVLMAGITHTIQHGGRGNRAHVRRLKVPDFPQKHAPIPAKEAHNIGNNALATLAKYGDVGAQSIKNSQQNAVDQTNDRAHDISKNASKKPRIPIVSNAGKGANNDALVGRNLRLPNKRHKQRKAKSGRSSRKSTKRSRLDRLLDDDF